MAWYRPWDRQGNVARDRRRGEIAERQAAEAATQDPYGPNAPQWDEAGFPIGPMPKGKYALDYQYEANRRAEQRRQVLWGDAQGSMRQAESLLSSYRPGGSAALASNVYGQRAGLYATQALNTSAPDLLIDWREQIRARAEENANELNRNAQLIAGLSSFNFLAGGTMTALQGQPATPQAGENISGAPGGTYGSTAATAAATGADAGAAPATLAPGGAQGGQAGAAAGSGALPGILAPERSLGGGATLGASAGGMAGDGTYGGGGGGQAGPGGPKRGAGGGRGGATDESGAGMGGAAIAGGGGLGDYSGPAVSDRALGSAPVAVDMTTSIWSEDPYREQGTAVMASAARQTLLDALTFG